MIPGAGHSKGARARTFAENVDCLVLSLSRRWLTALTLYGAVLAVLPVVAPMLKAAGLSFASSPIYFAYQFICHQQADRSLHVHGEQMAFCARDFAIFTGAVGVAVMYGILTRLRSVKSPGLWLVPIAILPIGLDGFTQLAGLRESTTVLRVITGLVFSFGIGWYLLPRLDAGFRGLELDIRHRAIREQLPALGETELRKA